MSTVKQCAVKLIEAMPDERVTAFIHFIADENKIARMETEILENDPNAKTYEDFTEFIDEQEHTVI